MEIVEIVIQGLRGFPSLTRIAPASGLSIVHPIDGREGAISATVLDLLFPKDVDDTEVARFAEPSAEARIGIMVRGRDGSAYRLLKDLSTGKGSLLKESAGGFSPVSNRAPEIAQAVTAQIGFPQEDTVRELFFTRRSDLPSQRSDFVTAAAAAAPPAEGSSPGRPLPPGFGQSAGDLFDFSHLSADEKQKKLAEVNAAIQQVERIKALEFELDGLQKQSFELEERLRPVDSVAKNLKKADEALQAYAHLEGIPDDLPEQWERYRAIADAQHRELATQDEERKRLQQRLARELAAARDAGGYLRAALRDPLILWGTVGGLVAVVLALVGTVSFQPLRWIAFADIPAFAVAVFGALRFIGEAETAARIRFQIERLQAETDRIKSRAELDEAHFKGLLTRFHVQPEDVPRLAVEIEARKEVTATREQVQRELQQKLGSAEASALTRQRDELAARIKALEEQLYAMGGYMGDINELRGQAEQLQRELSGQAPARPVAARTEPSGPMPAATVPDATKRLMELGRDLFLVSMDDLCQMLQARAGQYAMGLSDRRYGHVLFGPHGEMALVETASGRPIPFAQLTPGDRDVAYLSLKLTLIETYSRKERLPVVLERAFETFPPQKDPLLARMLQFLGGVTQVICMTSREGLLAAGGHRVQLP